MITKEETQQCKKCKYRIKFRGFLACNYFGITGKRRPSPCGELCKEYEAGRQILSR